MGVEPMRACSGNKTGCSLVQGANILPRAYPVKGLPVPDAQTTAAVKPGCARPDLGKAKNRE